MNMKPMVLNVLKINTISIQTMISLVRKQIFPEQEWSEDMTRDREGEGAAEVEDWKQ